MHSIPHHFDLNLLLVFNALYNHKHVGKAAESIYISPSAFSHALNRLRDVIDDPLFIRMKGEMLPTKKAEEIAPFILQSLELISSQLFKSQHFDAASSDQAFMIATTDYTAFCTLPLLMKRIRAVAPNIKVKVTIQNKAESFKNLLLGTVDAVIGYSEQDEIQHPKVDIYPCFSDRYVVIAPKGMYRSMTLAQYVAADHIRISSWGEHNGMIDASLKAASIRRKIALELPNMMVVPYILQTTNLIITLPRQMAELFHKTHAIDIFELPFDMVGYQINVYAPTVQTRTAPQHWLVNEILNLF